MAFKPPRPFFCATQIINSFLNSRMSANHNKMEGLLANAEILKGIVEYLQENEINFHKAFEIKLIHNTNIYQKIGR